MDNYKKYLFDEKFGNEQAPKSTYSFGNPIQGTENSDEMMELADNQFDDEYKKDFLKNQVKSLREKLIVMGFPSIGDLFSQSTPEIETTIKALFAIISQRKQDMDFRNQVHDRVSRIESDKMQLSQNLERCNTAKRQLEQDNTNHLAKLKSTEKAAKEQINKLLAEKEDITKQFTKIQNRSSQFEHEIKQRDLEIQKLKDHLKKAQSTKNFAYKNTFEITNPIEQNGPSLFAANGEYEFSQLVMKRWEEVNNKLMKENEQLRESLIRLHNELNEILQVRKDVYVKRRRIDFGEEGQLPVELENPQGQLHQFKQDLYKAPLESTGKQAIQMLQENLGTFKELMKKFDTQYDLQLNDDQIEVEGEGGKLKACKNLSELFKNYNYIFDAQDKMISQIINKSQSMKKIDDLNYNVNRFNRVLDDKQIDEVRKYLSDQKKYLDESKSEMEMIKKQFQSQLKKREDEKSIIQMKRQMLEETNDKFKENIRMLENASKQALQQLNCDK